MHPSKGLSIFDGCLLNKISTPRWVIILIDFLLNCFALLFAYLIRFDLKANNELLKRSGSNYPNLFYFIFFAVKVLVFYWFKIHKGLVRFTSTEDLRRIFLAVLTCSSIFLIGSLIRFNIDGYFLFPMSVLMMEFLASFAFTIGSRFVIKLIYLESIKNNEVKENVVIYGAGVSGLLTKRTIEKDRLINQNIVGFLDENKKLDGNRLEELKFILFKN